MSDADFAIKEGSSLHYSLLWTDPQAKERFCQRLNLIQALATTLDDVQEPQVAEKKIHWWHEELQRLHAGTARHPATTTNQSSLKSLDNGMAACLDIVSVASTQRFTPAETTSASEAELARSYRARLALLAHALSNNPTDLSTDSHPELAALALAQHEQLARLPNLIHRGLPVFSDELYKQFGVRPHDLAEHIRTAAPEESDADGEGSLGKDVAKGGNKLQNKGLSAIPVVADKPGRQNMLTHAIDRNYVTLTDAVADQRVMARYRQHPLLPLWRLIVLRKYQLALWEKRQPDLLRERTTLTPLAKLYRAWQNRK